jgi:hypothetical protein
MYDMFSFNSIMALSYLKGFYADIEQNRGNLA